MSDPNHLHVFLVFQDLLQAVKDPGEDSTDDEGIDQEYHSDSSEELEFESDEEGNYLGRKQSSSAEEDEESGDEEGEEEEEEEDDSEDEKEEESPGTSKQKKSDDKPSSSGAATKKASTRELPKGDPSKPEYQDSDTSDEEDIRNTVGNIPMHWYDEYKHIGYDWDAKKIIKPPQGDQIDEFLRKIEDPDFWRTVKDPLTGQDVRLTDEDIALIKRIVSGRIPNKDHDEYEPWIEWFTSEVEKMPIKNVPDHKRSFLPSVSEKKRVSRMVHALKMGWMKTTEEVQREKQAKRGPKFYMLWETDTSREHMRRIHDPVSAPKRDLPGHAESYNPPPEYLFDAKETKEWLKLKDEPHKRKLHFMPQKFKSLREVPAYSRYLRERFLRCLDLYLCPRAKRVKLNIDAEYLIPKLPSPRDLQPFPTVESMVYRGHTDLVRSVSVEPKGEYLVSGSDDKTVKSECYPSYQYLNILIIPTFAVWEIATGRCIRTIETDEVVRCVAWCPNPKLSIIAVATGYRLLLVNPKVGDKVLVKKTDDLLAEAPPQDVLESERIKTAVQWSNAEAEEQEKGVRVVITHFKPIRQVTWHGRGDYLATVMPEGANRSALIHQLSKRRSQIPFSKSKGLIQFVLFHPVKPCFFVAVSGYKNFGFIYTNCLFFLVTDATQHSHL